MRPSRILPGPGEPGRTLIVLGAFGRTGYRVIAEARRRGWIVLAADRRPDAAQGYRRLDSAFIEEIRLLNAPIISALGPDPGEAGTEIGDLLEQLVTDARDRRLVWVVGATVPLPGDHRGWLYRLMPRLLGAIRDRAWFEKNRELALLLGSQAKWTAVRPPRLTDEEPAGEYDDANPWLRAWSHISRATLARFLVDCVETDAHIGSAPLVVSRSRSAARRVGPPRGAVDSRLRATFHP